MFGTVEKGLFASNPEFLTLGLEGISEVMKISIGRERGLEGKKLDKMFSLTHNPPLLLFSSSLPFYSLPPSLLILSFLPLINFKRDILVAIGETSKALEVTKETTTCFSGFFCAHFLSSSV